MEDPPCQIYIVEEKKSCIATTNIQLQRNDMRGHQRRQRERKKQRRAREEAKKKQKKGGSK